MEQSRTYYRYGLSADEYDEMVPEQGGLGKICGRPPETRNGIERKLSVDHSHKFGRNRTLLCSRCNLVLGHIEDQPELARRMMEYLLFFGETLEQLIERNPETAPAREAEWQRSFSELGARV